MAQADPFAAPLALLEDILEDEVVAAEGEMGVVALLLAQRDAARRSSRGGEASTH